MNKIELIYFDAGGGHRASAVALQSVIEQQKRPWQVQMVNLRSILDPEDQFRRLFGVSIEDNYNKYLSQSSLYGATARLRLLQGSVSLLHIPMVRRLQSYWAKTRPDLVVSLIPNFDRALYRGLKRAMPQTPFITLLTDIADCPPHFWIEPDQDQFFICGSHKAAAQARSLGYTDDRIYETSGMILRPSFYDIRPVDRATEQRKLGLDPAQPTGLVLFGGYGSEAMLNIAVQLPDTQLIMIRGRNDGLAARLRTLPAQAPRAIVGFTEDIPAYMRLADFFIGKPGPGSISEAVQMHLPVIVERNRRTMPQERYNTIWVEEHKVGIVIKSFDDIRGVVAQLLPQLEYYRANTRKLNNRAVFEIPDILEDVLNRNVIDQRRSGVA